MTSDNRTPSEPSHSIQCTKHGFYYNPQQHSGCAACRNELALEPEPSKGPSSVTWLMWLVAIAVVAVLGGRAVRGVADKGEDVVAEARATSGTIDPNQYRAEIQDVEAVVYEGEPAEYGRGMRIFEAAMVLSDALMRHRNRLIAGVFSSEVLAYGQRMSTMEDVGYSTLDMTVVRSQWEEIRDRIFQDADWYQRSEAQVDGAESAAAVTNGLGYARALDDWAREVEALVRSASLDAMGMGELSDVRRGSAREAQLRRSWQTAAQSWSIRLQTANRQAPMRPRMGGDPNAVMAYQQLEGASRSIEQLISSGGNSVPPKSYRQRILDRAQQQVQQARRYLAQVQQ
jgi:hypothetical protein